MELAAAWLLFPLALVALCVGWGSLVVRLADVHLPAVLVPPLGFAALVVATGIVTMVGRIAHLAPEFAVGGAVAGLAASWPWRFRRSLAWPVSAAVLVFACYAAPIVLSGQATFAGYLTLDDSATLFAMTDRMLEAGRSVHGLAPSTYEATLSSSLMVGYPTGSLLPLGVGARLSGQDVAWVFQPYLAVVAGMLALTLWHILSRAVVTRSLRVLAVVVAAQPALLFAYGLWTGVKELSAAVLVALTAALAVEREGDARARAWLPLAMGAAAVFGVLSLGGVVWLTPLAVLLVLRRRALRARSLAAAVAMLAVLALPAVAEAARFLGNGHVGSWSDVGHLANLIRPLNVLQVFGIWPALDFRIRPDEFWQTAVLVTLVAGLAAAGLARAWRLRDGLLAYAICAVAGATAYWLFGSPWIGAKALATASPALLALAAAGCAWLAASGRRVEAGVATVLVVGGVLWSNVLAYANVNLAPRPQLAELARIGDDFAGQGPALMTEYEPVGVRHFLRRLDPEGASELRRHVVPLRSGVGLDKLQYANLDAFQTGGILFYRTLVLRRSPTESRPPSPYVLRQVGRYYEVWQRPLSYRPVLEHLPLGDAMHPGAVPDCAAVRRLASRGQAVAAVSRADPVLTLPVPARGQSVTVVLPRRARYSFWLAGSTRDRVDVLVDGRSVGGADGQLNNEGQYVELARARIGSGSHTVALRFERNRLLPGTGGPQYGYGPLVVARTNPQRPLIVLPATQAGRLCGRTLDWVEALG